MPSREQLEESLKEVIGDPSTFAHLPDVRPGDPIQAILTSDIHFSHTPPIAFEGNWYDHQWKVCHALRKLKTCDHNRDLPIIVAGDLLHSWNQPPELINFLIKHMPNVWGIPGQHDLPFHRYDEMHKSAFGTLVGAEKVTLLSPGRHFVALGMGVMAVPWGFPIPKRMVDKKFPELLVCHKYIWDNVKNKHPQAKDKDDVTRGELWNAVKTYDAAVFGDNHQHFYTPALNLINTGCLMRRTRKELEYVTRVGLLHKSGVITPYDFPELGEKFKPKEDLVKVLLEGMSQYTDSVKQLEKAAESTVDFVQLLKQAVQDWRDDSERKPYLIMLGELLENL